MSEKLYGHFDDLMDYETYPDHVMAMTVEKLHGKAEIAAELAYRDTVIAEQQARIEALEAAARGVLAESTWPAGRTMDGMCFVQKEKLDALNVALQEGGK